MSCPHCNGIVDLMQPGYSINALNKYWHKECFKCNKCGIRLFSFSKFFDDNGFPMCAKCNKESSLDCFVCNLKITESYLTADENPVHVDCFKCCHCNVAFDGGFFEDEGKLWHLECYGKAN
eukprot:TRINITY_DN3335_c0_g1_i4.p1 TRINITY_DN3335_c0_g1~~TRINITY_DN3335_c0_g1_i4.p1  ORF type:complete len:121 (-),score=10.84 TRINITY_DN3335_c0_g1_i4:175-537(-)